MKINGLLRRLRGTMRVGAAVSIAASAVTLLAAPSGGVNAAPGDLWDITGQAAGDSTQVVLNGYGASTGMGVFELTNQSTGEVDYAFCIDPSEMHSNTGNIEHGSNTVNNAEVDYIAWKYANASTSYENAIAAQGLIWYYIDGLRSNGIPVWWDTLNNNAVTPFSPDAWNNLPPIGYTAPAKPVGFQSTGVDDAVEVALYNMALDVESNHGPWTASDTGTPGQVVVSNPVDATYNPNGRVSGAQVQWVDQAGNVVATSTTNSNGVANDPTGNAVEARIAAPGTHREANVGGSQMLGFRPATDILTVTVAAPVSDPTVATQISTSLAVAGAQISDSVILSGMQPGQTATVQLQLFNLTHDPAGTGTPLVDVTISGIGNGTTSGLAPYMVTLADAGDTLGYRERIVATTDGAPATGWSALGVASETTPVDISNPAVVTQISTTLAVAGETITDSVMVSGLVGGATATVQLQLFNLTHDPAGTGTPLVQVTIPNLTNGTHAGLAPYLVTLADAGDLLGYREQIVSTTDGITTGPWSELGISNETTPVDISDPAVVTQISDQEIFAGETITDSITITGLVGGALADVQLQLFNLTDDPNGTGTPLVDVTIVNLDNGTHSGFGSYVSTLDDEGDQLGYRERIVSVTDGAAGTAWSALGIANETTSVLPQPQVVTNASGSVAAPGNVISDSITVIDIADHLGESIQVEVSLYDLTVDADCSATPLTSEVVTISADGTYTGIAPYTVLTSQRGHVLGYVERIIDSSDELRLSDDEWTESVCGEVSETLFVVGKAHLATQASLNSDLVIISDLYEAHTTEVASFDANGNAVVETVNIPAETVEVTATLHGPFANVTESGFLCDEDTVVETVVLTGMGEGVHTVEFSPVSEHGVYTFEVSFSSETLEGRSVSHGCGIAAETFVSNPDLGINTNVADGLVTVENGAVEVADVVTISDTGIDMDGEAVSWDGAVTLFGPYMSLDAATCAAGEAVGTVAISGTGDVADLVVDGFSVAEAGIYTFVAEVTRDVDGMTASHPCGLEVESFVAVDAPEVVTAAADAEVELGQMTHDIVTISGVGNHLDGTPMAWQAETALYGPFASVEASVCDAGTLVDTVYFAGAGNGEFASPQMSVDAPGVYTYITSVTSNGLTGTHPCGVVAESFRAVAPITVNTQTMNAAVLIEGDVLPVSDYLTIEGAYDGAWTATATLYGPFESMEAAVCDADTAVGTVTFTGNGDGTFQSPTIDITEGGVFTFVANVTRDIDGETATHDCGIAAETVTVTVEVPELPATGGTRGQMNLALALAVLGLVLAGAASRQREIEC